MAEEDVREAAFKVKAPLELSRKPVFWLTCFGRLYEKGVWNLDCKQACPPSSRPFFCALRAPGRLCRPGLPHLLCGCARGGPPFRCGETSGLPHYRAAAAAYPSLLILPQQNGGSNASRTKAAVRRAQLRGFAKQTGKDGEDHGIELARIPEILRLFQPTAATITQPISINDWFLWYFL